jgi:hypothetical protein
MKECRIIFRWIRKQALILQIKKYGYFRIFIYDVERTKTSQAAGFWRRSPQSVPMNKNAQVSICRRLGSLCGGDRAWRAIWTFGGLPASIWPCVVCQREWMWIPWDCLEYFVTRMFSCHQYVYHGR